MFKVRPLGVPVISVGNITVGGAGKTPVVELLIRSLSSQINKIAIVTRGYKRKTKGLVVVSDGRGSIVSVREGGDEPIQIARKFPNVVVIADEKRTRGCEYAITHFRADIIILDDAYQHRACKRDIDIVVVDATQSLWNDRMLPAGRLREPLKNLHRADVIVLSKCEPNKKYEQLGITLSAYVSAPVITSQFIPDTLRSFKTREKVDTMRLRGKNVFSFCGVGSPVSFKRTIDLLGAHGIDQLAFPDHHHYTEFDVYKILSSFRQCDADFILTTEKDTMRLEEHQKLFDSAPLFYPEMKVEILQGEKEFFQVIERRILHRNNSFIRSA